MSEREIDNYIALVSSLLRLNRSQREQIGSEMRDHLDTRVEALMNAGHSRKEAIKMSLEEFGDAAGLAIQFVSVVQQNKRRWLMRFASLSIVGMFLVLIASMAMWPKDANFGAPENSVAQQEDSADSPFDNNEVAANPFDSNSNLSTPQETKSKPVEETIFAKERNINSRIEAALDSPADIDYVDADFRLIKQEIEKQKGFSIFIHSSAKDAGLGIDDIATFQFGGISLRNALDLFLDDFDCSYVVKNGMLVLASSDSCPLVVKTFDCSELLELLPATPEPANGGGQGGGGFGGGGAGGGGGIFSMQDDIGHETVASGENQESATGGQPQQKSNAGQPSNPTTGGTIGSYSPELMALLGGNGGYVLTPEDVNRQNQVINLIRQMVSPESWEDTSGVGAINFVGNVLVVRQRGPELHRVGQLLDDLTNSLKIATQDEEISED